MKFLADENIEAWLVRGLLLRQPELDIVRVQDVGLLGVDDRLVLEWAATEERILITHDVRTMPDFAYERIAQSKPMPGVLAIRRSADAGHVIEDIMIVIGASTADEWEGRVVRLPF